jgi:hypothetical protein
VRLISRTISLSILGKCSTTKDLDPKWITFPSMLKKQGISLVACSSSSQSHHFDLESYPHTVSFFGKSLSVEDRTLIRVEPIVVNPYQYRRDTEERYGKIVVISPNELKSPKNQYWESGYIDFEKIVESQNKAEAGVAIINENKYSFVSGSNYKLRKRVIEEFLRRETAIKVAGKNWDQDLLWQARKQISAAISAAKYHGRVDILQVQSPLNLNSPWVEYFGRVESAQKFLSESKFAIVIENDSTYVSEKLLNAVIAGCIPLYCGPSLGAYEIPAGVAISLGKSPKQFVDTVLSTPNSELEKVREVGQKWIRSSEARKRWSVNAGFERLINIIKIRIN